jgi:DNA mismatch endonuclease (patch repair protein)
LRNDAGLSQDKLAEKVDLDRTYLSGIEHGVRNPGIKIVIRLARALRVTGWRRHVEIRGRAALPRRQDPATEHRRPTNFRVRPDFVFRRTQLAIFVDGCFWHGCPKHATKPANNRAFWKKKLAGNKIRDRVVNRTLRRAGWRVIRIWEHELQRGKHRTFNIEHRIKGKRKNGTGLCRGFGGR